MSGLDSWLMSDLEVWITLLSFGAVMLAFAPTLGAWSHRRSRHPGRAMLILLLVAALGGLAWYVVPTPTGAVVVTTSGVSGG
jgi:hypothetical protein